MIHPIIRAGTWVLEEQIFEVGQGMIWLQEYPEGRPTQGKASRWEYSGRAERLQAIQAAFRAFLTETGGLS